MKKYAYVLGAILAFTPLGTAHAQNCGIASHYGVGDGLHGRRTASGGRLNAYGHSAAHRTLSFGTRLTVTNPRNGRSVVVVINDRGPFVRGRSLDLSYGAARAIGLGGTGRVCWE